MAKALTRYVMLGTLVEDDGKSVYSDSWIAVLKADEVREVLKDVKPLLEWIAQCDTTIARMEEAQRLLALLEPTTPGRPDSSWP